MKWSIITIAFVFQAGRLFAQETETVKEIQALEQMEVKAVLAKDTVTLKKLWDKDYVVNNPENKIIVTNANPLDRPVLNKTRMSFTREVEHITVKGNIVISMGNETVRAAESSSGSKLVKRRYTNVWLKEDSTWKLVARHANIICHEK